MKVKITHLCHLFALSALVACNQAKEQTDPGQHSRPQPSAQAVIEWRDQKYSMFIHFGLFSLPAGVWKNEKVTKGYSEQIRAHGKITKEEFHELAKSFNPKNWNADSVATLAKRAGMKSIVITSKHHDGFAMYHTAYSDFNIVEATPFHRDVIKELSEACQRQGLKFGVYFSLIDWDFPDAVSISEHNSDSIPPRHHELNLHQVQELMTNYGPMSEIWFDMGKPTLQQSTELADLVRKYQPDCLVSGRLWNDQGDFAVMGDNASPDFRMGTLWQTPASMFDETWGYRSWQVRGDAKEKAIEKLTSLIKVVSNGGSYLLNIGPMDDGGIVPFEREVLLIIGAWMAKNKEAIYGTSPSPLPEQSWGSITGIPNKLFLFINNPPQNNKVVLKGMRSEPTRAYSLSDPTKQVGVTCASGDCTFDISTLPENRLVNVVTVEYAGSLLYSPSKAVEALENNSFQLTVTNAVKYHSYSGAEYYSTKPTVIKMEWPMVDMEESYSLKLLYTPNEKGKTIVLNINGDANEVTLDGDEETIAGQFSKQLGTYSFQPAMTNTIEVTLADQANPHRDMKLEGLVVILEK